MDFGLSDDQRQIQRTARELLSERARPERVREHAEAESSDKDLWRELCALGWPGIAVAEENELMHRWSPIGLLQFPFVRRVRLQSV